MTPRRHREVIVQAISSNSLSRKQGSQNTSDNQLSAIIGMHIVTMVIKRKNNTVKAIRIINAMAKAEAIGRVATVESALSSN